MATIIEQAVKGQRKAMEHLYGANKQKVYYVSLLLLGNEVAAAEATSFAFKNVWGSMTAHAITTEDEFTHLAIRKAVDYCKRKISKQNPKAFRIPQNRNFLIAGDKTVSVSFETVSTELLESFPSLQRFILVLHSVGEYLPEQIASTFKFDMKTVGLALEAERTNVERVTRNSAEIKQSYESAIGSIRNGEEKAKLPASVDEHALSVIDGIATPIEKKKKKKIAIIGVIALTVCVLTIGIIALATRDNSTTVTSGDDTTVSDTDTSDGTTDETAASVISSPVIDLDETLTYYADIEIADYGTITVELDQEAAPVTVANFVNLAQNGFYDGLTFHRIMEDFMMQGGDPNGDGTGGNTDEDGNEINIVGEFTDNGYENSLSHTRGAISMARSSDYDSASSQFFIVHEDSTSLDGQYAVFGYVTEGLEIVDGVCESAEPTDDNGTIEADAQPIITSITIRTE